MSGQAAVDNDLVAQALGCTEASEFKAYIQDLLSLDDQPASGYIRLGLKAWDLSLLWEAVLLLNRSFNLDPHQPLVLQSLGELLIKQGKDDTAKSCLKTALTMDPSLKKARYLLGLLLIRQRKFDEAIEHLEKCLSLIPNSAEVLTNLAIALRPLGRLEEAITRAEQALELCPRNAAVHFNLALLYLNNHNWTEGWHHHEWRQSLWADQGMRLCIPVPEPKPWAGTNPGRTKLVLVAEQGLGDTLQFVRYAPQLQETLADLRLCVPDKLVSLISFSYPNLSVVAASTFALTDEENWIPLISAPHWFGISPEDFHLAHPYLQAPEERQQTWSTRLKRPGTFLVGVHWQGNPNAETSLREGRSFPLEAFAPLAIFPELEFISLQKGAGSEQLQTCSFRDRFVECQEEISNTLDFIETAAITKCCDLVITSDSGLAHLAGALSVPTWLILHCPPDWRWGKEAEATNWYPNMCLFRLALNETWTEIIDRLAIKLAKHLLSLFNQWNKFTLQRCLLPSLERHHSDLEKKSLPWRTAVISMNTTSARFQDFLNHNRSLLSSLEILLAVNGHKYHPAEAITTGLYKASALGADFVTNGTVGAAASHRLLWQSCLEQNVPLLILEDDVIIHAELNSFLHSHAKELGQADIILFGANTDSSLRYTSRQGLQYSSCFKPRHPELRWILESFAKTEPDNSTLHRLHKACGLSCYLITPEGAKKLLDQVFPLDLQTVEYPFIANGLNQTAIDWRLSALYDSINAYITMPFLAYSPNTDSSTKKESSKNPKGELSTSKHAHKELRAHALSSIHAFIINWPGTFERCQLIEKDLLAIGVRVQVINSDPEHNLEGWLNLGPDAFFGDQLRAVLENLNGEILLHIHANIIFDDWHNLLSDALRSQIQYNWAVYAPNVLSTFWSDRDAIRTYVQDGAPDLTLAACVDKACLLIDKSMIQLFYAWGLNLLLDDNNNSLAWDVTVCAISHLSGRSVLRNYQYTAESQISERISSEAAVREVISTDSRLPPSVRKCMNLMFTEPNKLLSLQ